MNNRIRPLYVSVLLLALLVGACSPPSANENSSNANSAQQANNNAAQPVPQNATPTATAPAPPAPTPPPAPAGQAAAKPGEKPSTERTAIEPIGGAAAAKAREPKLVVPVKRLDFGKQPQDKTLTRSFVVRNAGNAELKIEQVVPS